MRRLLFLAGASLGAFLLSLAAVITWASYQAPATLPETTPTVAPVAETVDPEPAYVVGEGVSPVGARFHDGALYVAYERGIITRYGDGEPETALDLSYKQPWVRLVNFAFGPEGRLHVTYATPDWLISLSRFEENGAEARLYHLPLNQDEPAEATTCVHWGGAVTFDADGAPYLTVGEGACSDAPDHPRAPLDPDNDIGNLVRVGGTGEVETVATGFRNPWRADWWDGRLVVADVGGAVWEEVNVVAPDGEAASYGFPAMEGADCWNEAWERQGVDAYTDAKPCDKARHEAPFYQYLHEAGRCAVIGGAVVGDAYVFGDYCSGEVWALDLRDGEAAPLVRLDMETRDYFADGETVYVLGRPREQGAPWGVYPLPVEVG